MELSKYCRRGFVEASSLLESVIAIAIITICLMIALQVHTSILSSRPDLNNPRLKLEVDRLVSEMKLKPDFNSRVYNYETYSIRKTVKEFRGSQELKEVIFALENRSDTVTYKYLMTSNE